MAEMAEAERAMERALNPWTRSGADARPDPERVETALAGRRVLILGAARSGRAAAELLLARGAEAVLADRNAEALSGEVRMRLGELGCRFALGREDLDLLAGCDLLVISPGVSLEHPLVAAAAQSGIEVIGELELASSCARAPIIAVTGTNGKSTTVTLLGDLLAVAGRRAPVAGNVGRPLADAIDEAGPGDLLVVEVSSFQLETTRSFRPQVAVLLNVAPDHLDRHHTLAHYRELKHRLFAAQSPTEDQVVPAGWSPVPGSGRRLSFSRDPSEVEWGATVAGDWIVRRSEAGEERILPAAELGLPGPHNLENALAAVAALIRYDIPARDLARGLERVRGLPHRLETVAIRGGVTFVNDSKATNVHALESSLRSFRRGVHLIAGGRDKAGDFAAVADLVRERVARIYRIGEASGRLAEAWAGVEGEDFPSLEAAVAAAARTARPGETVLLAPGCASFDMFRDFEHRGDVFRRTVRDLARDAPREDQGAGEEP